MKVGPLKNDLNAVVYLARYADGEEPIRRFVESYKLWSAGRPHDLFIIWKGFPNNDPNSSNQKRLCSDVLHHSLAIGDIGFDISAYRSLAETIDHSRIFCLNTFSEISHHGWLSGIDLLNDSSSIGVVGCTASNESLKRSAKLANKVIWLCAHGLPYDQTLADQWGDEIAKVAPHWLVRSRKIGVRDVVRLIRFWKAFDRKKLIDNFEKAWITAGAAYDQFPPFPNPHVRSNAFAVNRELFLFTCPKSVLTKDDAYRYESGVDSMTNLIIRQGLKPVVIGKDMKIYGINDWAKSETFRSGAQKNNLVSDNQTRKYDSMPQVRRSLYMELTWGTEANGIDPVGSY